MASVASVPRSIVFYARLGFELKNEFTPDGADEPSWAHLERGAARLMLSRADDPVDPAAQAVLFYLYYDDVPALHAALADAGFQPGPIAYPFYCPKGEFPITDPDGYRLMLTHT
jgi:hypothetical protein